MDGRSPQSYARLGLKPITRQQWMNVAPEQRLWRVAAVERNRCMLLAIDPQGALVGSSAEPGDESVAVGDWALLEGEPAAPRIARVLERSSWLRRGSSHQPGREQLIAANIDTVFIVAAFAETEKLEQRSLRARRLDRFISAVAEGGATSVVLLNKVDVSERDAEALDALRRDLTARLGGVEVLVASAR